MEDIASAISGMANDPNIALAGVSTREHKFGYKIFHFLRKAGYNVYPVNPRYAEFEGQKCYAGVSELPELVKNLVIVTPADQSLILAREAIKRDFKIVWFQPGSFDEDIHHLFENSPINAIIGDCVMVELHDV